MPSDLGKNRERVNKTLLDTTYRAYKTLWTLLNLQILYKTFFDPGVKNDTTGGARFA